MPDLKKLFPEAVVNVNGELFDPAAARISVFDRGFLYGDSVYEVTISKNACLAFFDEHLDRLFHSAALIGMTVFVPRDTIIAETLRTLSSLGLPEAYLRIVLTRGETAITLDPSPAYRNNLVIIAKPPPKHPARHYAAGLHLALVSVLRNDRRATDPNAKSGNYLNNILALKEAKALGAEDAVMVNADGEVTESTTSNLWMVRDGTVITPALSCGILRGITRGIVLDLCRREDIRVEESAFPAERLLDADEVFLTSSTRGVVPVRRVNQTALPDRPADRPVTDRLMRLYRDVFEKHLNRRRYTYTSSRQ